MNTSSPPPPDGRGGLSRRLLDDRSPRGRVPFGSLGSLGSLAELDPDSVAVLGHRVARGDGGGDDVRAHSAALLGVQRREVVVEVLGVVVLAVSESKGGERDATVTGGVRGGGREEEKREGGVMEMLMEKVWVVKGMFSFP